MVNLRLGPVGLRQSPLSFSLPPGTHHQRGEGDGAQGRQRENKEQKRQGGKIEKINSVLKLDQTK